MQFKYFVRLWILLTGIVVYEHLAIKFNPENSLMVLAQSKGLLDKNLLVSAEPGKPFSYFLGWAGFGIMLLTNFYIFRKRFSIFKSFGKLNNWLNLHIFFGMFGPTLIIFHSDFKVRGIVAISFWSMVISASSGFIGRYFYVNSSKKHKELENNSNKIAEDIKKMIKDGPEKEKILEDFKQRSIDYMCLSTFKGRISFFALPRFVLNSLWGDIKILFKRPVIKQYPSGSLDKYLKKFGVSKRNEIYADTYRRLLSYWHNFHLPFAFFMYITAIIHIVSSLMFRV
jgi:hypothetical protein